METVKTWRALKKASLSEDGHFLEFSRPVVCFKYTDTFSSILVTDERKRVYNLIFDYVTSGFNRIIVTGIPGIGTVRFFVVAIVCFLFVSRQFYYLTVLYLYVNILF